MEKLGSHWTNFYEIWYWNIFRKFVDKIQVSIKSDKNNEYFTWIPMYITVISRWILLKWHCWDKYCRDNQNAHLMFSDFFFVVVVENRAMYETLLKEPDRPQMAIRRMRIACQITKATNARSECVILIACRVYFHASQIVSIDSESTSEGHWTLRNTGR